MQTIGRIHRKAVRAISKHDPIEKLKELEMPSEGKMRGEAYILKRRNSYCRKEGKKLFSVVLLGRTRGNVINA